MDNKPKQLPSTMKKILSVIALASSAIFSAHGALVYTTFGIPAGSSNVGTFNIQQGALSTVARLSETSSFDYSYAYAYRFFTPTVTGQYTLGMTDAPYDAVMILYSGQTSFPVSNPWSGAIALDDDGLWDYSGGTYYFGTQTVNPRAANGSPDYMPLIKNVNLSAGVDYLVAMTSFRPFASTESGASISGPSSIPLPAEFFVAGAAAVNVDGVSSAAVPEPGQVAASLLLLAGLGGYVFLKRRKATKTAAPVAA